MKWNYFRMVSMALLSLSLLCSCGSAGEAAVPADSEAQNNTAAEEAAEPENTGCDEAFLADFSEAIQARWAIGIRQESEESTESQAKQILECIDAEKGVIEPKDYRHQAFEDNHLYEDAIVYLNALDTQEEILKGYEEFPLSDEDNEKYTAAISKRFEIIVDLYDNYDLKIDSKYIKYVNKTHNEVWISKYGSEPFWQMLNTFDVEEGTDADNNYLATFRLTNQTEYTFKDLGIQGLVFLIVNNEVDHAEEFFSKEFASWEPGETVEITLNGLQLIEYGFDGKDIEIGFYSY